MEKHNNNDNNASDLQKAIDDITKSVGENAAVDTVEQMEARLKEQLQVPAPAPVVPAEAMPPVPGAKVPMDGETQKVKEAVLRDLAPLMGKVEMEPKQKFELYREMLTVLGDKSVLSGMHEVAKGIGDEGERAGMLLDIIRLLS